VSIILHTDIELRTIIQLLNNHNFPNLKIVNENWERGKRRGNTFPSKQRGSSAQSIPDTL